MSPIGLLYAGLDQCLSSRLKIHDLGRPQTVEEEGGRKKKGWRGRMTCGLHLVTDIVVSTYLFFGEITDDI